MLFPFGFHMAVMVGNSGRPYYSVFTAFFFAYSPHSFCINMKMQNSFFFSLIFQNQPMKMLSL